MSHAEALRRKDWVAAWWLVLAGALAALAIQAMAEELARAQDRPRSGWIDLFDGESLDGWQVIGEAEWNVVDGTIRTAGEKRGFLMTTREFADFELQLEFRVAEGTNSGVFLRSVLEPTDPTKDCYELNIAPPENPFPTGSLVARKKVELDTNEVPRPDEWHRFEVTARGGRFTARLDGKLVLEYDDPAPIHRGRIGLQSNQGAVAFRDVRIREPTP